MSDYQLPPGLTLDLAPTNWVAGIQGNLPEGLTLDTEAMIEPVRKLPVAEQARASNSLAYAEMLSISPQRAYTLEPGLNKAFTGEKTDSQRLGQYWTEGWRNGIASNELGELLYKQFWGDTATVTQSRIDELNEVYQEESDQWRKWWKMPARAVRWALEMAPLMLSGMSEGAIKGVATGGTAAGAAAIAGLPLHAAPGIGSAAHGVGILVAAQAGFGVGMTEGVLENIFRKETGLAYGEFRALKTVEGEELNPGVARAAALGVGVVNTALEALQIGRLFPGLTRAVTKMGMSAAKRGAFKFASDVGTEAFQEVLQESANVMFGIAAREIQEWMAGVDPQAAFEKTVEELQAGIPRVLEAGYKALGSFGVMTGVSRIGGAVLTSAASRQAFNAALEGDTEGAKELISRFSDQERKGIREAFKEQLRAVSTYWENAETVENAISALDLRAKQEGIAVEDLMVDTIAEITRTAPPESGDVLFQQPKRDIPPLAQLQSDLAYEQAPLVMDRQAWQDDAKTGEVFTRGSEMMLADMLRAVEDPEVMRAETWYEDDIAYMRDKAVAEIPELADENHWAVFAALAGITSTGTQVLPNMVASLSAYKYFLRTGRFPLGGTKDAPRFIRVTEKMKVGIAGFLGAKTMADHAERLQYLVQKLGIEEAGRWLTAEHQGAEMHELFKDFGGVTQEVTKGDTYYGMEFFGPKTGQFALALMGNNELLVKDRWFNRTWNRYMGTPIKSYNKNLDDIRAIYLKKGISGVESAMADVPRGTSERRMMERVVRDVSQALEEKTGKHLSISQIQAIMWYSEKKLYEQRGVKTPISSFREAIDVRGERLKEHGVLIENAAGRLVRRTAPQPTGQGVARDTAAEIRAGLGETEYASEKAEEAAQGIEAELLYAPGEGGAVEFLESGQAIMHLSETSDFTTFLHELGHIFRRRITQNKNVKAEDWAIMEQWTGVQDGIWTEEAEERFAEGFVKWIEKGTAPSPRLARVFETFRKLIKNVVRGVLGEDALQPEVRKVYDQLFTAETEKRVIDFFANVPRQQTLNELKTQYGSIIEGYDTDGITNEGLKSWDAFQKLKEVFFGNRDTRVLWADQQAKRIQGNLVRALGKKKAQACDQAIHAYIDIGMGTSTTAVEDAVQAVVENRITRAKAEFMATFEGSEEEVEPGFAATEAKIRQEGVQFTPEQQKLLDDAQNLPPEAAEAARTLSALYDEIGADSLEIGTIHNLRENYVNRIWDLSGKEFSEVMRSFTLTTRHSKRRVFSTLLEGWAAGYTLKVKSATNNYTILAKEMSKVNEGRRLVDAMVKAKDADNHPIATTRPEKYEGYVKLDPKIFKRWDRAGQIQVEGFADPDMPRRSDFTDQGDYEEAMTNYEGPDRDIDVTLEEGETPIFKKAGSKDWFVTDDGTLFIRRDIYAPKEVGQYLNRAFGESALRKFKPLKAVLRLNNTLKMVILSVSLYHHQALLRSFWLASGGKEMQELTPLGTVPAFAAGLRALDQMSPEVLFLVKNGLTLDVLVDWSEYRYQEQTRIGKAIDKIPVIGRIKQTLQGLHQGWMTILFGKFGAGLKVKAAINELKSEIAHYPDEDPNVVARRVAALANDDFGGLHLERMGRSKTMQDILRILLLAPDWTESNVRTAMKAVGLDYSKIGPVTAEEIELYQKFWMRAIVRGAATVAAGSFLLAGGDLDEMWKRRKEAWEVGPAKLKWLDLDITPIYEALGAEMERGEKRYFNVVGHFKDPLKWAVDPMRALKYKASVGASTLATATSGTDWASRRFTTVRELFEDKGIVEWGPQRAHFWEYAPSWFLYELHGLLPIPAQSALDSVLPWFAAEQFWMDSLFEATGFAVTPARTPGWKYREYQKRKRRRR